MWILTAWGLSSVVFVPYDAEPMSWTTTDGIEATIEGRNVTLRWERPERPIPADVGHLKALLEPRFLAMTLHTGVAIAVSWPRVKEENPDTGEFRWWYGAEQAVSAVYTEPFGTPPFVDLATEHWAFQLALMDYREALELHREADPQSALGRAYLALERVVKELEGKESAASWSSAGETLGYPDLPPLYYSLQFARHVDPDNSRAKLRGLGYDTPIGSFECVQRTGEVLKLYAAWLLRSS